MPWRTSLSSVWIKGLMLSASALLLLTILTSGYSLGMCSMAKACHGECCPCSQGMCIADTTEHQVVIEPGMVPSLRVDFLSLFAAVPWHAPALTVSLPHRYEVGLLADPGRFPSGPSRPQLSVWLI
ncbi:hypothetical protein SAMN05444156_0630 [Verrucomicrobium sp. GAS474]|nr:hypothetical protein SAMN05444156_0630 [Verrucomicrobium sp. GAS474]